jgi:hypothetical protein
MIADIGSKPAGTDAREMILGISVETIGASVNALTARS